MELSSRIKKLIYDTYQLDFILELRKHIKNKILSECLADVFYLKTENLTFNVDSRDLYKHTGAVLTILQLKGGHLAAGSEDSTVTVWNTHKRFSYITQLRGHNKGVTKLFQLKNGDLLTVSKDNTIRVWDHKKVYDCYYLFQSDSEIIQVGQLKDGRIISLANVAYVWTPTFEIGSEPVRIEDFRAEFFIQLEDQRILLTNHDDVSVWDPADLRNPLARRKFKSTGYVKDQSITKVIQFDDDCLAFIVDNCIFTAVLDNNDDINIINIKGDNELPILDAFMSQNGRLLITISRKHIAIYNTRKDDLPKLNQLLINCPYKNVLELVNGNICWLDESNRIKIWDIYNKNSNTNISDVTIVKSASTMTRFRDGRLAVVDRNDERAIKILS
jgi:WD40 repeat protein